MIFSSQLKKLDNLTTDEQLKTVSNHLRKMQEELEYRLSVLDSSNISEIDADTTNIFTKGENLINVIEDQNGNVSSLAQTVGGLTSTVANQAGDISVLQQTAQGLTSTVSNQAGSISSLQQTASSLSSVVASQGDSISSLSQTASSLKASVNSLSSNLSTALKLDASGVYITDQDGNTVSISGSQIDVATLYVNNLYGSNVYLKYPVYGASGKFLGYSTGGVISLSDASTASYAFDLTSYGALRLTASSGDLFLDAPGYITLSGSAASCQSEFHPGSDGVYDLGRSDRKWADVYGVNNAIGASDRTLKTDITYGLDEYEEMFKGLQPVSYRFKDGTSGRKHTGFISQDVEEDLEATGHTSLDFAGFIKSPKLDEDGKVIEGEYDYGLRYGEFIALNTHMIQKLMGRVEELERRVSELEGK